MYSIIPLIVYMCILASCNGENQENPELPRTSAPSSISGRVPRSRRTMVYIPARTTQQATTTERTELPRTTAPTSASSTSGRVSSPPRTLVYIPSGSTNQPSTTESSTSPRSTNPTSTSSTSGRGPSPPRTVVYIPSGSTNQPSTTESSTSHPSTNPASTRSTSGRELPLLVLNKDFPENQTVLEGNTVTLRCVPLNNTIRLNVTWESTAKNNRTLPPSANITFNATRYDSGEYRCVVSNGVEVTKSTFAFVDVLHKPLLDVRYPKNHQVLEGGNITLRCMVAAANPQPNITWYKSIFNTTVLSRGVNLTFSRISRCDAGYYYCTVGNGIGQVMMSRISSVIVQSKNKGKEQKEKGDDEEGDEKDEQCKRARLIILLLVIAVGTFIIGIVVLLVFCLCVCRAVGSTKPAKRRARPARTRERRDDQSIFVAVVTTK